MKAYLKESATGSPKLRTHKSKTLGITTKLAKLVTRNANRTRKKAARQEAKRMIAKHVLE